MSKTRSSFAKSFKKIHDKAAEELEETPWWKFKKVKHLRTRIRWANHHYSKNNGKIQEQ